MEYPVPYVLEPTGEHTHSVILLHGRGSCGEEFSEELSDLNLQSRFPGVRWVFPSAKPRWSNVFQEEMSEWFETPSLTDIEYKEEEQLEGLRSGVEYLRSVVEDEVRLLGGSADKVVLGGISQGEAMALHLLLCGRHRFAAFVGMSGWLPLAGRVEAVLAHPHTTPSPSPAVCVSKFLRETLLGEKEGGGDDPMIYSTPVFLGHGRDDIYVDVGLGKQVYNVLTQMKFEVDWKEYEGAEQEGHWVKEPEEVDDIVAFLKDKI